MNKYTLVRSKEGSEWVCYVKEVPTMKAYGKTESEAMANLTILIVEKRNNENLA